MHIIVRSLIRLAVSAFVWSLATNPDFWKARWNRVFRKKGKGSPPVLAK